MMRIIAISLMVTIGALLVAGCSGGDNGTGPTAAPSALGSTHSTLSFSGVVEAVKQPDKVEVVFTNNSEDTLRCRLNCSQEWLKLGRSGMILAADSSADCGISVTIAGLDEGTYFDTIWIRDSDSEKIVRRIPVKLKMIKNETYLEVDDPDMNIEYLGVYNGDNEFRINCTWKMICHSNGGNPCRVFEYAVFSANYFTKDVNILVKPDLPTGQQLTGNISFYVYTSQPPPLRISFYVRIGYRALDKEDYLRIDYSY